MIETMYEADHKETLKDYYDPRGSVTEDEYSFLDYLQDRMIAVDTEYQSIENHAPESDIERKTGIHKVFCVAFTTKRSDKGICSHREYIRECALENYASEVDAETCACYNGTYGEDLWEYENVQDEYVVWIDPKKPNAYRGILAEAARRMGVRDPIFVNYSFEAEWEAFHRLGDFPERYPWLDCYLLYRLKTNIQGGEGQRYKDRRGLVHAVEDILNVKRNQAEKDEMRELCINDRTEGREQEIMDYCLEDVRDLIPLALKLLERLKARMDSKGATKVFTPSMTKAQRAERWDTFFSQIMGLMDAAKAFARISHRGIPVNVERMDAVHKGATKVQDKLVSDFVDKYPDTWRFEAIEDTTKTLHKYAGSALQGDYATLAELTKTVQDAVDARPKKVSQKTLATIWKQTENYFEIKSIKGVGGVWHKNEEACRRFLKDCLAKRGILDRWERTETGKLSMSSDVLEDEFKDETDNFGADFYRLCKAYNTLNGIAQDGDKSWLANLDRVGARMRYRSLRPFTAATGRCQPKTSKGFIFGWYKALYGVIEPPPGKWLVELDFSAEETLIQAKVFGDPRYDEIYQSKDMYLWMGVQLGMIPRSDFETMTKAELKHKYKETRDRLKTYTLALGYGAGDKKLASKVKLPVEKIKHMKDKTKNEIFPKSTAVREYLQNGILSPDKGKRTRCFWLQSGWHTVMPHDIRGFSPNAPLNFPIQGTGAAILHKLVVELEKYGVETLATIHDAIFFMVDEDDWMTIGLAKELMRRTANTYLTGVPYPEHGIKVGDPEIIKHGDIWTPEHAYDALAKEILNAGGYAC